MGHIIGLSFGCSASLPTVCFDALVSGSSTCHGSRCRCDNDHHCWSNLVAKVHSHHEWSYCRAWQVISQIPSKAKWLWQKLGHPLFSSFSPDCLNHLPANHLEIVRLFISNRVWNGCSLIVRNPCAPYSTEYFEVEGSPAAPRPGWPHFGAVSRCRVWQLSTRGAVSSTNFAWRHLKRSGLEVGWILQYTVHLDVQMPNEDIVPCVYGYFLLIGRLF